MRTLKFVNQLFPSGWFFSWTSRAKEAEEKRHPSGLKSAWSWILWWWLALLAVAIVRNQQLQNFLRNGTWHSIIKRASVIILTTLLLCLKYRSSDLSSDSIVFLFCFLINARRPRMSNIKWVISLVTWHLFTVYFKKYPIFNLFVIDDGFYVNLWWLFCCSEFDQRYAYGSMEHQEGCINTDNGTKISLCTVVDFAAGIFTYLFCQAHNEQDGTCQLIFWKVDNDDGCV